MRLAHFLIAPSYLHYRAIACAETYEAADEFRKNELEGRGLISLHLNSGAVGPCPVCGDGEDGRISLDGESP